MSGFQNSKKSLSIIHGPHLPPLRRLTWGDLLQQQYRRYSNEVAVVSQHQNEVLTYADLQKRSDTLLAGLLEAGIERGDRVAVLLGNRSEYVDVSCGVRVKLD